MLPDHTSTVISGQWPAARPRFVAPTIHPCPFMMMDGRAAPDGLVPRRRAFSGHDS